MNISGKTIAGLAAIALAALAGCGGEPTTPKPETTANIQGRALERIKTIEEQLSSGEAKAQDVRTLITSLNYLAARARAEQVGAAAQVIDTGIQARASASPNVPREPVHKNNFIPALLPSERIE